NTLNGGKWKGMMDYKPRNLPVFERVKEERASEPVVSYQQPLLTLSGAELKGNIQVIDELGYSGKAAGLLVGEKVHYDVDGLKQDSLTIELRLLPTHPINGNDLRFAIALDGEPEQAVSYKTKGRSEEWKMNVLRNQAIRRVSFPVKDKKRV